jgi:putrescine:ornithine antiporter
MALLTISPNLSQQFQALVDLAVVINIIPYILSMAAIITLQLVANVPKRKALITNLIALVGVGYSYFALYESGTQALMLGGVATILGFTFYGFVSARFVRLERKLHPHDHDNY